MHQQPVFNGLQYFMAAKESYCDYLFDNGVCLPSSSNMTVSQQDLVIENVIKIFKEQNFKLK
jgi:pyridoxal phosphate-dependent aminotransferase EpsN